MRSHPTATTTHAPPHAPPPQRRPHPSARPTHSTRSRRDTERIARAGSVCACGTAPDAASSTPHLAHTHPRGGSTRPTSTATRCSAPARTRHSPRTPSPPTTSPPCPARPATDLKHSQHTHLAHVPHAVVLVTHTPLHTHIRHPRNTRCRQVQCGHVRVVRQQTLTQRLQHRSRRIR